MTFSDASLAVPESLFSPPIISSYYFIQGKEKLTPSTAKIMNISLLFGPAYLFSKLIIKLRSYSCKLLPIIDFGCRINCRRFSKYALIHCNRRIHSSTGSGTNI